MCYARRQSVLEGTLSTAPRIAIRTSARHYCNPSKKLRPPDSSERCQDIWISRQCPLMQVISSHLLHNENQSCSNGHSVIPSPSRNVHLGRLGGRCPSPRFQFVTTLGWNPTVCAAESVTQSSTFVSLQLRHVITYTLLPTTFRFL